MSFIRALWPDFLPARWVSLAERWLTPELLVGLSLLSGVLFCVSLFGASWAVRRLPADYLLHDGERARGSRWARGWLFLRNGVGVLLLVLGVMMLALPGQGVLTILAAFTIMSFPGKRRLEHRLMVIPSVLKTINRLRRRSGHPPLVVPPGEGGSGSERASPEEG